MKNAASETKNSSAELRRSSWMSALIPAEDVNKNSGESQNKAETRKDERKRNSSGNQVRGGAQRWDKQLGKIQEGRHMTLKSPSSEQVRQQLC